METDSPVPIGGTDVLIVRPDGATMLLALKFELEPTDTECPPKDGGPTASPRLGLLDIALCDDARLMPGG